MLPIAFARIVCIILLQPCVQINIRLDSAAIRVYGQTKRHKKQQKQEFREERVKENVKTKKKEKKRINVMRLYFC